PHLLVELGERRGEKLLELLHLGAALLELDAGVDVLGVLAEDDHVHEIRTLHWCLHPAEIPDRPETHVQVELLTQRDVERSDAAADGRRERSLDADEMVTERGERFFGQPVAGLLERLFAGEHFAPDDLAASAVHFFRGSIKNAHARAPDVRSCPISFDERNDRTIRNLQSVRRSLDPLAARRHQSLRRAHVRRTDRLGHSSLRSVTSSSQKLWKSVWKTGAERELSREFSPRRAVCT